MYIFLLRSSFLLLHVLDMCRITCLYLRACDSRNIIFLIHYVRRRPVPVEASSCLIIIQKMEFERPIGSRFSNITTKSSTTHMYCLFGQKTELRLYTIGLNLKTKCLNVLNTITMKSDKSLGIDSGRNVYFGVSHRRCLHELS